MKLRKYIYEYIKKKNFESNYIWVKGQGHRGQIAVFECEHDNSRKTSSIVTKLVHMNLTWSPTKEFDDERFATDPRSRSEVNQKRCMCIHDNSRKTSSIVTKLVHMNLT